MLDKPSGHLREKWNQLCVKIRAVCVCGKEIACVLTDGRLTVQLPLQRPITVSIFHTPPVRDTHTHTHTLLSGQQFIRLYPFQHFCSNERAKRMFSADKRLKNHRRKAHLALVCIVQGQRQQVHSMKTVWKVQDFLFIRTQWCPKQCLNKTIWTLSGHQRQEEIFLHSLYSEE